MSASQPIRHPDLRDPEEMTRRAWWLVALNFLLPGSAQAVAGDRLLGRIGLTATALLWGLGIAAFITWLNAPAALIGIATARWALWGIQILAIGYLILWIVLTLDTLRLVRLVRVRRGSRLAVALLSVSLLAVPGVAAGLTVQYVGVQSGLIAEVFDDGDYAEPIDGRYTILLLGGDSGSDRFGLRPDSISVASIDAASGRLSMIGIPRNLEFVPFSDGSPLWDAFPNGYDCGDECLISYLYTYAEEHPDLYPDAIESGSRPGIEATRDAVEGVLGVELQYYALIDMRGFEALIDALGGIDITVEERLPLGGELDDAGNMVGIDGWIEAGAQHMDGHTALWYARSRISTNDFDRMRRQREVQAAVLAQIEPATVLSRFEAIAEAGKLTLETDIPESMLGRFAELALLSRDYEVVELELVPPLVHPGSPDYEEIHAAVAEAIRILDEEELAELRRDGEEEPGSGESESGDPASGGIPGPTG